MPLLDDRGKVLGKFNLFDLFVAILLVALSAMAYHKLTAPYRVAPPYALEENRTVAMAELQLPAAQVWMCEIAAPGLAEVDPRTGEPRAEVLGCTVEDGLPIVQLRIHAVRDASGRLLFEGVPLLPGRELQLDTEAAILEGVVRQVDDGGRMMALSQGHSGSWLARWIGRSWLYRSAVTPPNAEVLVLEQSSALGALRRIPHGYAVMTGAGALITFAGAAFGNAILAAMGIVFVAAAILPRPALLALPMLLLWGPRLNLAVAGDEVLFVRLDQAAVAGLLAYASLHPRGSLRSPPAHAAFLAFLLAIATSIILGTTPRHIDRTGLVAGIPGAMAGNSTPSMCWPSRLAHHSLRRKHPPARRR